MRHLYRLYRNHHCCTTIAVQAVQEWCNMVIGGRAPSVVK